MSLAELLPLALKASIVTIVFGIGLTARPEDLVYLVRKPGLLARSLLAMMVIMPLVAFALARSLDLPKPVAIILIALSLAPVPPLLPGKQVKAGGHGDYAIGLLIVAGLLSVVWLPVAIEIEQRLFGVPLGISPLAVGKLVAFTIIVPLLAGMLVGRVWPGPAQRLAPTVGKLGSLLLLAAAVVILVSQWRAIVALLHGGALLAMAIFVVVGLLAGHLLGGPAEDQRTVLALATASRHPGIAMALAHANFPTEKAVVAAVLLFLLAHAVLLIPYVAWRKRVAAT